MIAQGTQGPARGSTRVRAIRGAHLFRNEECVSPFADRAGALSSCMHRNWFAPDTGFVIEWRVSMRPSPPLVGPSFRLPRLFRAAAYFSSAGPRADGCSFFHVHKDQAHARSPLDLYVRSFFSSYSPSSRFFSLSSYLLFVFLSFSLSLHSAFANRCSLRWFFTSRRACGIGPTEQNPGIVDSERPVAKISDNGVSHSFSRAVSLSLMGLWKWYRSVG